MKNYKINLLEQYKDSQGINKDYNQTITYMIDFVSWILKQQLIGNNYIQFLKYLGLPFDTYDCAEVGKNVFDTLVKPYKTTIITPDTEDFNIDDQTRIINGNFQVERGLPTITVQEFEQTKSKTIPQNKIKTYMTQNPYSRLNIINWENLHNSQKASIILGAYGNIHDKDIEEKIMQLQYVKEKLIDGFQEKYEEHNGEYYYVLYSDPKVRSLQKR